MTPAAKGELLSWLTIDDFTPGIITNSDYAFSGGPVPGSKLGQAQEAVGCIALPNGGLAPLPGLVSTIAPNNAPGTFTQAFSYTGSSQGFTVPAGVTSIIVDMAGGAGGVGSSGGTGGLGGRVQGTIAVSPGDLLGIYVGGEGAAAAAAGSAGGFGYGAGGASGTAVSATYPAGGGGGSSAIYDTSIVSLLVEAAGGGGGAYSANGGAGGNTTGGSGTAPSGGTAPTGGTQLAGGSGGTGGANPGASATGAAGGAGGNHDVDRAGGGGGAGHFGGGGGSGDNGAANNWSSGAGGSNFVPVGGTGTAGYQSGNGYVTITYTVPNPTTICNGLFVTPGVTTPGASLPASNKADELIYGLLVGVESGTSQDWQFNLEKLDVLFGGTTAASRVTLQSLPIAADGTSGLKGFINMMTGGMTVVSGQAILAEPVITEFAQADPITVDLEDVISGQPIVLIYAQLAPDEATLNLPTITDDFPTPYDWTDVVISTGYNSGSTIQPYLVAFIGTGGVGEAGTITCTSNNDGSIVSGAIAYPCIGASTASGTGAVDVSIATSSPASESTLDFVPLTPSVQDELAIFATISSDQAIISEPNEPLVDFAWVLGGVQYGGLAVQANPTAGAALSPSWALAAASQQWCQVGLIVKPQYTSAYLPVWLLGYWFSGGSANNTWGGSPYQWMYPNLASPSSSTPSELQPHATGYPADVLTHQNRMVLLSLINSTFGPTVNLTTNEMFNYTDPPATADLGAQQEYFVQEYPVGAGAWGSISASELFLVKHEGGGYLIQGDLNGPTVTRLPGVTPTYGVQSRTALTPIGVVYASQNRGLWAWNGGQSAQKISPQLEDDFFISSALSPNNVLMGPSVDICRWGDWIVCTNDWLFDTNLGGWWKLPSGSQPHLLYGESGNAQTLYTAVPNPTASVLLDLYSRTAPSDTFTWTSFPIRDPSITHAKPIQIREVTVRAQGTGTVTVTLTGIGGTSSATTSSPSDTVSLNSNTQPVLQMFNAAVQAHDVIVNISSVGQSGGPAPTVYSVSIGWEELAQDVSPG